jgi:hypothetical protein
MAGNLINPSIGRKVIYCPRIDSCERGNSRDDLRLLDYNSIYAPFLP